MAKKGQTFNNYPKKIKVEILRKYFEEYISVRALSEEYGISPKTIQNWVYKTNQGKDILVDHRQFSTGRPKKEEGEIDYKILSSLPAAQQGEIFRHAAVAKKYSHGVMQFKRFW